MPAPTSQESLRTPFAKKKNAEKGIFLPDIPGSSAPWKSRKAFNPTHSAALAAAAYSNDSKSICALSISPV